MASAAARRRAARGNGPVECRLLTYFGEGPYKGFDVGLRRALDVHGGGSVVVSIACARRLMEDFGMLWDDLGPADDPRPVRRGDWGYPANVVDMADLRSD